MNGTRYYAINENVVDSYCPRHIETEDWNHVVKFRCTEEKRNACLRKLRRKLENEEDANEDCKIVNDIRFFFKKNETSFENNQ